MKEQGKNITIADVAEALGISKTTVSRAISGKGRIGESTRQRVFAYIEEHDYKPNVIAKSLAQSRTFNLCVVMPGSFSMIDMPFFKEAFTGIQEIAEMEEYDILLSIAHRESQASLERIISNHKVDGVILLRTFLDDPQIELLQGKAIPYVTTGSTNYENVKQVDFDHERACYELTSILLMKHPRKVALLGGDPQIMANQNRYRGCVRAFREFGLELEREDVYRDLEGRMQVEKAVEDALRGGADCILCMDDAVCVYALAKLRTMNVRIPEELKIASFYNSTVLEANEISITSLDFDSRELGMAACRNVLAQIAGEKVADRQLLSYEVVLGDSTK